MGELLDQEGKRMRLLYGKGRFLSPYVFLPGKEIRRREIDRSG